MSAALKSVAPAQRSHKATYARDKRKGGYLIRIEGPHSAKFAGRAVPVTMKDNSEHNEDLDTLVWSGTQDGKNVALYTFKAKPRSDDLNDEIVF